MGGGLCSCLIAFDDWPNCLVEPSNCLVAGILRGQEVVFFYSLSSLSGVRWLGCGGKRKGRRGGEGGGGKEGREEL